MFDAAIGEREQGRVTGKYFGKYPGLVLDNAPPEGAAHRGQLKVQIPGLLEETPDGSDAQPIETIAAPSFLPGFFFIPEVGDHVWVEFVAGDINCAIWTGVWYPTGATPKMANEQAPTEFQKVIRTASGHVVQLDDTAGEEKVEIVHASGSRLMADEKGSVLIANKNGSFAFLNADDGEVTLGEEHGNLITMTDDGVMIANKGSKVTLEMKEGNLTILSSGACEILATKAVLHCSSIILGGEKAVEDVLLGKTFMILFNAHTHPTPMGPSGPPIPLLTPANFSKTIKISL